MRIQVVFIRGKRKDNPDSGRLNMNPIGFMPLPPVTDRGPVADRDGVEGRRVKK